MAPSLPSLSLWWYLLSRAAFSCLARNFLVPRESPKKIDIGHNEEVGHLAYPAAFRWGLFRGARAGLVRGRREAEVTSN